MSTVVTAKEAGRRFIVYEIDEKYVKNLLNVYDHSTLDILS